MKQGDGLHSHFLGSASKPTGRILYHCVNQPVQGNALLPTCERTVNGQEGNYLFAATHLSKALAFAFDYKSECPDIVRNGGIAGTDDEFVIICKGEKTLREMPLVEVYAFDSETFEQAWPGQESRQFVSQHPLPLAKTKLVLKTNNVEDLMRHGLQIFSTEKTFSELGGAEFLDLDSAVPDEDWLMQLLDRGDFRWENKERQINPTPQLLELHGVSRKKPMAQTGFHCK